ncbi:hypothetical protein Acr_03g0008500 [Actinidia rufa]|uniref:Uncharacterized protein n=1 Tax=Actinidia rufa TaxID=165716 RepID=A0A7J0ED06_9ERIC|nr:hypothetical protein Acr_03g0008500 [Actinidia rufa]
MSSKTILRNEESEQSLPSWISDHLGGRSYIDETNQSPSFPPVLTNSPKMDTSSLTKENNIISQAKLDNLGATYSFPPGAREELALRISEQREGMEERGKSCNKLPALSEVDAKRTETVFGKIEPGGYFEVSKVLGSRTFKKHFVLSCTVLSSSGGDNTTSGDDGEFGTREDSVEYLGVIRRDIGGAIRRVLPGIPDKTLLRWLGGKVKDSFMNLLFGKFGSSSDSGLDFISDFELPPELRSDGGKAKAEKAVKATTTKPPTKGVVIRKKTYAGEGDHIIEKGSESMMSDASVARRLLIGVIPASNKKEVDQLSENDLVAKSFHALGQVVVFASSLALRSQEHLHDIDFHMARADSAELELVKAQKRAVKAENRLAELSEEGSKPGAEVDDLKATVAELTNKLAKAKELAIEDFKASGEFKAAVTDSAATYFSEGFEFYKRQLLHQFPNLSVDVANMAMDPSFAEEEEAMKEGEDPIAGVAPDAFRGELPLLLADWGVFRLGEQLMHGDFWVDARDVAL